jgi:hypothetical protein
MEEEGQPRHPRKCLKSLIALIRLFGGVIERIDWLNGGLGADKKCGCGLERGEATSQPWEGILCEVRHRSARLRNLAREFHPVT